ncbi:ligase-associated DNA damage response endonuclease PdeM [Pacificimonas sp. WHA3]|uniref:Ligase-associated DNA damage response endonuclease PdeM n=1 Tax=Pacificimonas pallii TaxID=2827236 RepID=A0ABS6SGA9_9SPHN|nr:ligase-associated DNA damage response endonuclease PdeM [Pacificimonas pallii]MBV7257458.1 ligase-associated DNA damage response endonuclease PdeM [Pacificimonas pallii]
MVPLSFAGQDLIPLPDGALWWPARRALLLADLHLEKASWFAAHGQMLPPYDSLKTLQDLAVLVDRHAAGEVWCLGDSFHDKAGSDRLSRDARALLLDLTARTEWTWITGNHDPMATTGRVWGGRVMVEAGIGGLLLRHEAEASETRPELSGHFHPKLRLRGRGRGVSRRCFVVSDRKIILPAFGALTGGLDAAAPPIMRAMGPGAANAIIPTAEKLLSFPLAA